MPQFSHKVVALSGGVGGATLALGLSRCVDNTQLSIITNTADDFCHLGLPISPDLDTVMYTLAGINNTEQGWGLAGETWQFMEAMKTLGGEHWFLLGDKDMATHIQRRELLASKSLTAVTQALSRQLNVTAAILPMCDEKVSTYVCLARDFDDIKAGEWLSFQQYFVKYQCRPVISDYQFRGLQESTITESVNTAIDDADALIVCPSNPFVSIEPILSVNGMRDALSRIEKRVIVSPIVAGLAIKGPAAKMMEELNMPVTALAVAELYRGFATHFVLDTQDAQYRQAIENMGMEVLLTNTVMKTDGDKEILAQEIMKNVVV